MAYTPTYGANELHINKTNPGTPERYYLSKITNASHRSFYEVLELMATAYGDTAVPLAPININDAKMVFDLFMLDHPEVFWLGQKITYTHLGDEVTEFKVERVFPLSETANMMQAIDQTVNTIISSIPDNATDMEAELIIVDWLRKNVSYGYSAANCYTLYGSLIDRVCVCEGYSEAFQYICGKIGIPATSIVGTANNGTATENHKWNAVKIGGKWYQLDVTWADIETNHWVLYINNSAYISSDHTPSSAYSSLLPAFTAKDAEYMNYFGLCIDSAAGSSSTFSFDKALQRTIVHFKTTLTDAQYYNCALIKVAPGVNIDTYVNLITSRPKQVLDIYASASLGDGYRYDSYSVSKIGDDTIEFWFYRQ